MVSDNWVRRRVSFRNQVNPYNIVNGTLSLTMRVDFSTVWKYMPDIGDGSRWIENLTSAMTMFDGSPATNVFWVPGDELTIAINSVNSPPDALPWPEAGTPITGTITQFRGHHYGNGPVIPFMQISEQVVLIGGNANVNSPWATGLPATVNSLQFYISFDFFVIPPGKA